jgi:chitinase
LGTWSVYRLGRGSFTIEHLDPTLCTHIIYSFAGLDVKADGIRSLDPYQDLKEDYGKDGYQKLTRLKQRYPHLKVSLAIGGWNEGSANYSALAKDPARRRRFVASAVDFIRKYNFDGLDLDWEFPGKRDGAPEDKLNFLLLVKELRAAFDKYNLLLTAAFGAGKDTIDVAYDVKGLSAYLDFIHMMCYDYHGAWDQKTGANAPLRSSDVLNVEFSINYMLKLGASPKKLVMGVPLYGRTFLLNEAYDPDSGRKPKLGAVAKNIGFQGPFTRENGFMGYNEICMEVKNNSQLWHKFWDAESSTPYAVSGNKMITYDDARSIKEKVRFAMQKDLAGIMVWSVDTDDFYGDCADVGDNGSFENFPLMRAINAAIETSIEELQADRENAIIHGNAERTSGTGYKSATVLLVMFVTSLLFVNFL